MMKLFAIMAVAFSATAIAQPSNKGVLNTSIAGNPDLPSNALGSGNVSGFQANGPVIGKNVFHVPQYLPGHPTAATIYPRIVEVDCVQGAECGYNWHPSMGRAEYLYIQPNTIAAVEPPTPVTIIKEVPGPERVILKEVPVKKKKE